MDVMPSGRIKDPNSKDFLTCHTCGTEYEAYMCVIKMHITKSYNSYCSAECSKKGRVNKIQIDQVESLKNSGLNQKQIAKELGISKSKLYNMKKALLIILLLIGFNSYSQSKFIELTYTLNTPCKFGETKSIEGRVIVTRKGSIDRYIVIVSHNSTYKIWIADIKLFKLIKNKEFLILENCKYLR